LLPALSWSVNFLPSEPATDISRTPSPTHQTVSLDGVPHHGVATGVLPEGRFLVIASQTCDILKPVDADPTVVALGAFVCEDPKILSEAAGNSVRYFLLDPNRKIVADATVQVVIEKPLLETLECLGGPPTETIRAQFGRWFGRRFSRPALPDDVQKHVVGPIGGAVRRLKGKDSAMGRALRLVQDVRFQRLTGKPPYGVNLLFIVKKEHQVEVTVPLGEFIKRLRERLERTNTARLVAFDMRDLYNVSAGALSDTDRIYLEDVSFQGGRMVGEITDLDDDESWV
jgi:hypothetical protein